MAAEVTVTGKTGAGVTVTAVVVANVVLVEFDCVKNMLQLTDTSGVVKQIDINAATTITATKSGSTYTFVVS